MIDVKPVWIGDLAQAALRRLDPTSDPEADRRVEWAPERRGMRRSPLPRHVRAAVLERDEHRCRWCYGNGHRYLLQADHIVPWSGGGSDHPVNLRALCVDCNQERSNRIADMYTAHALAIAWRCTRCALPLGDGSAIAAYCLTCKSPGHSPFGLLGGRIPTVGVPPAALVDVAEALPVVGHRQPTPSSRARALARARAELDQIRAATPDGAE